jgi:hypothetical protein
MDTKAENITANGREWTRRQEQPQIDQPSRKAMAGKLQINAAKMESLRFASGSSDWFWGRSESAHSLPLLVASTQMTALQKSITGRASMNSDRSPHYPRQSAFICGLFPSSRPFAHIRG